MEEYIYNKRETISAWKTVLSRLTGSGRPWSHNLFNKNLHWLLIDKI